MNRGSSTLELKPNRLLLDPYFGGYKLNLDNIPVYRKGIETGVRVVQPGDNQYSFYHVKLFSLHNHLHVNSYLPNSAYFVDKNWKVFKIISVPPHHSFTIKEVLVIPQSAHEKTECYNISVVFASPEMVIISNGYGLLYFAKIVGQGDTEIWVVLNSGRPFKEEAGCVLSDARIEILSHERVLSVLLLFIEEKSAEQKEVNGSLFQTILKWRTFVEEDSIWRDYHHKQLCVDGSVSYAALEIGCRSLHIISDSTPSWVHDSENPIEREDVVDAHQIVRPKLYNWTQTEDEISITIPLGEQIKKTEMEIEVEDQEMNVKLKKKEIISGRLFHRVRKELTTWSLLKDRLEIQLIKHEGGLMWKVLVLGDEAGEEVIDHELVKSVHEKLAHLCTDKIEEGSTPSFNSQQLEECDAATCDTAALFRISGETHAVTHEVSLSSLQWLFKVSCDPLLTPAICVRHDVDACVWQFHRSEDEKTWPHEHIGTFSAFGYVQASKTQKKFVTSPPNLSYVAVCEASHHIYIYRQPTPMTSELKNRHTGKKIETISKQQLVNLETKDQILGVYATNHTLFVLLENSICVLVINPF